MYQVVTNAVHSVLLRWWLYIQSIKIWKCWFGGCKSLCVERPVCRYDTCTLRLFV